jgi:CDP-glucose 4,6-dehydratase
METYDINVMGTVNVLEALRALKHPCAAVLITTDKCYAQKPSPTGYREEDALGGNDPYSSSKAAAELAIAAYRCSFFSSRDSKVAVASARSGNVLGGGDWAADRLVPDCIRSLRSGTSIAIRNRSATRPWQFVLDPLRGYLELGAALSRRLQASETAAVSSGTLDPNEDLASAFNFGSRPGAAHSVSELVEEVLRHWPGACHDQPERNAPHEAQHLRLATNKAFRLLGWSPQYDFHETVEKAVDWYRESSTFASEDFESFVRITRRQITEYELRRRNDKLVAVPPRS